MHAWIRHYCLAQLYRNLEFRAWGPLTVSDPTSSLYRLGEVRPRDSGQPIQGHTARAVTGPGHRPTALCSPFHSLPCFAPLTSSSVRSPCRLKGGSQLAFIEHLVDQSFQVIYYSFYLRLKHAFGNVRNNNLVKGKIQVIELVKLIRSGLSI